MLLKSVTHSLQWRLLSTLTTVCLLFSGLVATVSFYQSYHQAQTLQDAKLESLVSLAKSHDLSLENDQIDVDFKKTDLPQSTALSASINTLEQDIATNQTLIYWLDDGRLQDYFSQDTLYHLFKKPDGFYEIQGKHGLWRLYLDTQTNRQISADKKQRRLVIGELLDIRNQLAWQSAKKTLFPLLLLIPLLLLVIIVTVHQMFKPLARTTDLLNQRLANAVNPQLSDNNGSQQALLNPLNAEKLPNEIRPFIQVIGEQMQHLLDSLTLNQRFVSNASHQLRTPMTAILLQAQQLKLDDTATPAQIREQSHAIDNLLDSIKRSNHLINQLLTLSKSEQKTQTASNAVLPPFSASQVVTEVLLDFYPIASQKNINLGVAVLQEVRMNIAELAFKIIVQNLVENAIKYTPSHGRVDISLFANDNFAYLVVQDSGIGIDEAELDNILEPFYRATTIIQKPQGSDPIAEGFGLGLAIVNNLVAGSHAEMTIANHQNLQRNQSDSCHDLPQKIASFEQKQTTTSFKNTDSPLKNPLYDIPPPQEMTSDFTTGLYVQIRWQQT